jgi:hypothetical protein
VEKFWPPWRLFALGGEKLSTGAAQFFGYFFHGKSYVLTLTKNGPGFI